jgi:thiol-disulfide isomerase/thioredoxin
MKEIFRNFALLVLFSFVFSSMFGCSGSNTSQNQSAGDQTSGTDKAADAPPAKKSSEYPPIASAVANADIKNLDGTTFKVADKKGKVVLLNMWATWCGPCRSEMPALVRMQDAHRANGFEVIGLNTDDESIEDIKNFSVKMSLNYPLVWADTKLQAALLQISKFDGIPQSFLIDRDGNLRGVFRGANPADIRKMEELVATVVNEGDESSETASAPPVAADNPDADNPPAGDKPKPESKQN